jgi:hypothetical protein
MERTDAPFHPAFPVHVYFNPHRRLWSVRQRGKVVGRAAHLVLRDVEWVVQPCGRERVRREGRKNVHAYGKGWVTNASLFDGTEQAVRYNPYELETFVAGNNTPLRTSQFAVFTLVAGAYRNQPRVWARGVNIDN